MSFLGVTRFSIFDPASNAWKSSASQNLNYEQKLERLYAPERIEPRLNIFLNYSLPQISLASRDHAIKHIVRYSAEMPEKYKSILKDAESTFDFLVLEEHTAGVGSINPYKIGFSIAGPDNVFGIYRLDDDDLLASNFFDQVARYIDPAYVGMKVSLAAGLTGLYEDGRFSNIRSVYHPMIAIGLMGIYGMNSDGSMISPPDGAHILSDRYGPVVVDAQEPSYFWTRHIGQDTAFTEANKLQSVTNELSKYPVLPFTFEWDKYFPSIADIVPVVEEMKLLENALARDVDFISVDSIRGEFSVYLDATYNPGMGGNGALLKFQIADESGELLSAVEHPLEGFTSSGYPSIGYFRYLNTYVGKREQSFRFNIPDGKTLVGVGLQSFGNSVSIDIHKLSLLLDK